MRDLLVFLLIPLCMVIYGFRFWRGSLPDLYSRRQISPIPGVRIRGFGLSGYRTRRSKLSPATWAFAHRYLGRFWFILGLVLLPVSIGSVVFCLHDADAVNSYGIWLFGAQAVVMLLPALATEIALRRRFDSVGRPIV